MATAAVGGYPTLLQRGDGGSPTENFTTVAEVKSISGPSIKLDTIDVTNMDSAGAWREYIPGLLTGGEITVEGNWIPTTGGVQENVRTDQKNRTKRNWKVVVPVSPTKTWAFAAYITGFDLSYPLDGAVGFSLKLQISGEPTLS